MCGGAYLGAPGTSGKIWNSQSGLPDLQTGSKTQRWSKIMSSKRRWNNIPRDEELVGSTRPLVEVLTDAVNSAEELVQEWEDIEFPVDSGASGTVVGEETVRAVRAKGPNPKADYGLADGSTIPNELYNNFVGLTEEGFKRTLKASVTDVYRPLLSVAQMVQKGSRVVFSPQGNYVEHPKPRERLALEQKGGLFTLRMWFPREENQQRTGSQPFRGQASGRP